MHLTKAPAHGSSGHKTFVGLQSVLLGFFVLKQSPSGIHLPVVQFCEPNSKQYFLIIHPSPHKLLHHFSLLVVSLSLCSLFIPDVAINWFSR